MAYVHCHACNWQQDDFWDFGIRISRFGGYYNFFRLGFVSRKSLPIFSIGWKYNPFSLFLSYVFGSTMIDWKGYWRPRRVEMDKWYTDEMGWKTNRPHSWFLIWYHFTRMIKRFRTQHWWTYETWKKDPQRWRCPKCGAASCVD